MISKKRIAIYIDGSNLYFSVKKAFNCKIDIKKLCEKICQDNILVKINYYISPVGESNPEMYAEQQRFFEKLRHIENLNIIFGRLEKRKRNGEVYYVEKASDVNLALDLALDANKNIYDEAYLISNDGDFSGAVKAAIEFGKIVVYVAVGSKKSLSYHLKNVSSRTLKIDKEIINNIKVG